MTLCAEADIYSPSSSSSSSSSSSPTTAGVDDDFDIASGAKDMRSLALAHTGRGKQPPGVANAVASTTREEAGAPRKKPSATTREEAALDSPSASPTSPATTPKKRGGGRGDSDSDAEDAGSGSSGCLPMLDSEDPPVALSSRKENDSAANIRQRRERSLSRSPMMPASGPCDELHWKLIDFAVSSLVNGPKKNSFSLSSASSSSSLSSSLSSPSSGSGRSMLTFASPSSSDDSDLCMMPHAHASSGSGDFDEKYPASALTGDSPEQLERKSPLPAGGSATSPSSSSALSLSLSPSLATTSATNLSLSLSSQNFSGLPSAPLSCGSSPRDLALGLTPALSPMPHLFQTSKNTDRTEDEHCRQNSPQDVEMEDVASSGLLLPSLSLTTPGLSSTPCTASALQGSTSASLSTSFNSQDSLSASTRSSALGLPTSSQLLMTPPIGDVLHSGHSALKSTLESTPSVGTSALGSHNTSLMMTPPTLGSSPTFSMFSTGVSPVLSTPKFTPSLGCLNTSFGSSSSATVSATPSLGALNVPPSLGALSASPTGSATTSTSASLSLGSMMSTLPSSSSLALSASSSPEKPLTLSPPASMIEMSDESEKKSASLSSAASNERNSEIAMADDVNSLPKLTPISSSSAKTPEKNTVLNTLTSQNESSGATDSTLTLSRTPSPLSSSTGSSLPKLPPKLSPMIIGSTTDEKSETSNKDKDSKVSLSPSLSLSPLPSLTQLGQNNTVLDTLTAQNKSASSGSNTEKLVPESSSSSSSDDARGSPSSSMSILSVLSSASPSKSKSSDSVDESSKSAAKGAPTASLRQQEKDMKKSVSVGALPAPFRPAPRSSFDFSPAQNLHVTPRLSPMMPNSPTNALTSGSSLLPPSSSSASASNGGDSSSNSSSSPSDPNSKALVKRGPRSLTTTPSMTPSMSSSFSMFSLASPALGARNNGRRFSLFSMATSPRASSAFDMSTSPTMLPLSVFEDLSLDSNVIVAPSSSSPFLEKDDEDDDDERKTDANANANGDQKMLALTEHGEDASALAAANHSDSDLDAEIDMSFFDLHARDRECTGVASVIEAMETHWTIATQKDARDKGIHEAAELSKKRIDNLVEIIRPYYENQSTLKSSHAAFARTAEGNLPSSPLQGLRSPASVFFNSSPSPSPMSLGRFMKDSPRLMPASSAFTPDERTKDDGLFDSPEFVPASSPRRFMSHKPFPRESPNMLPTNSAFMPQDQSKESSLFDSPKFVPSAATRRFMEQEHHDHDHEQDDEQEEVAITVAMDSDIDMEMQIDENDNLSFSLALSDSEEGDGDGSDGYRVTVTEIYEEAEVYVEGRPSLASCETAAAASTPTAASAAASKKDMDFLGAILEENRSDSEFEMLVPATATPTKRRKRSKADAAARARSSTPRRKHSREDAPASGDHSPVASSTALTKGSKSTSSSKADDERVLREWARRLDAETFGIPGIAEAEKEHVDSLVTMEDISDHSSNFSISFAKPLAGPSWLSDPFSFADDEQQQPQPSPTNLLSARDNDDPANALAKVLVSTYKTCQRIGLQYPKPPPSPSADASKSPPLPSQAVAADSPGTQLSSPGLPTSLTLTLPPFSPLTSPMRPKPRSRKRKRRPVRPTNRFQSRMKKMKSEPQREEPVRSSGFAKTKKKTPILGRLSNVHASRRRRSMSSEVSDNDGSDFDMSSDDEDGDATSSDDELYFNRSPMKRPRPSTAARPRGLRTVVGRCEPPPTQTPTTNDSDTTLTESLGSGGDSSNDGVSACSPVKKKSEAAASTESPRRSLTPHRRSRAGGAKKPFVGGTRPPPGHSEAVDDVDESDDATDDDDATEIKSEQDLSAGTVEITLPDEDTIAVATDTATSSHDALTVKKEKHAPTGVTPPQASATFRPGLIESIVLDSNSAHQRGTTILEANMQTFSLFNSNNSRLTRTQSTPTVKLPKTTAGLFSSGLSRSAMQLTTPTGVGNAAASGSSRPQRSLLSAIKSARSSNPANRPGGARMSLFARASQLAARIQAESGTAGLPQNNRTTLPRAHSTSRMNVNLGNIVAAANAPLFPTHGGGGGMVAPSRAPNPVVPTHVTPYHHHHRMVPQVAAPTLQRSATFPAAPTPGAPPPPPPPAHFGGGAPGVFGGAPQPPPAPAFGGHPFAAPPPVGYPPRHF